MVEYSENYQAHAEATATSDWWQTDSREELTVGITPEFGGDYEGASPENYYAVALTNCYVATFKAMADNSDVTFDRIVADGSLRLRPDDGTTVVDLFFLDVSLHVQSADRKTRVVLERAQSHCFILHSVDFEVTVETEIVES